MIAETDKAGILEYTKKHNVSAVTLVDLQPALR